MVGQWVGPDLSRATELVERSGTKGAEVTIGMSPCLDPTAKVVADTLRDLGYHVHREIDGPLRPEGDLLVRRHFAGRRRLRRRLVQRISLRGGVPRAAAVVRPARRHARGERCGGLHLQCSNFCDPEIDRRMQRAVDLQLTDAHAAARAFERWNTTSSIWHR